MILLHLSVKRELLVYDRLDRNPNNSNVGIGIKPIFYVSPLNSDSGNTYAMAEIFFLDVSNSISLGKRIYGYVDFFNAGQGGFNISIPTCYTKTSKRIDGCELNSKEDVKKWVRKSQKAKTGFGKPVFQMSFAKYVAPPSEPKAKGIPLDF